nr:MAG TPA: hypothetical protein [Caudoviricetes sp.]
MVAGNLTIYSKPNNMFNVRARAIYSQYMIPIGADLTIILGLGFVRASCSVIEESRTFFIGCDKISDHGKT